MDSLRFILEAAEIGMAEDASRLHRRLNAFANQQLIGSGGRDNNLASKVFAEIEKLGNTISKAQKERQSAVSNTTAPSAQGAQIL